MDSNAIIADWLHLGNELGVDFSAIDPMEFVKGCDHELEHWQTVQGNPEMIAGIAHDHLREDKDYYRKLEQMEQ